MLVGAEVEVEASGTRIGQREGRTVCHRKPREVPSQAVVRAEVMEVRLASDRCCNP